MWRQPLRRLSLVVILLVMVVANSGSVVALSGAQKSLLKGGVQFFDIDPGNDNCTNGGDSETVTLTGSDNAQKIYNYFSTHGYTPEQTAGMMGNMVSESHFNPLVYQGGGDQTPPLSGDAGWGIVQWTPGSKVTDYIKASGTTAPTSGKAAISDYYLKMEIEYLAKQLDGTDKTHSEKAAGDDLKSTTGVADAAVSFLVNYERAKDHDPNGANAKARIANAKAVLKLYGGTASDAASPSDDSTGCDAVAAGALGTGTGAFNTNTTITLNGADKAVAHAKQMALMPGGDGTLFHATCDSRPAGGPECLGACSHVMANVWGYASSGRSYAVGSNASNGLWYALKASGHAHPGDRSPPIGALLFYSTGKLAGHVAVYVGDNLVFSNDVGDSKSGVTGGLYITSAKDLEGGAWNLNYLGWAEPVYSGNTVHYGP